MPIRQHYIMLIDDDEDDLEILTCSFTARGYLTKSFTRGINAITYLHQLKDTGTLPNFIILDYNMPDANGQDILQMLKTDNDLKQIPVVIYSTTVTSPLKKTLMDLGAYDCLVKPSSYDGHKLHIQQFTNLATSIHKHRKTARKMVFG